MNGNHFLSHMMLVDDLVIGWCSQFEAAKIEARLPIRSRVLFERPAFPTISHPSPLHSHMPMADEEGLIGLQGLHQDLVALEAFQLRNIDRLWADLERRVGEFRQLLDKPSKSDTSRKALQSGEISYFD